MYSTKEAAKILGISDAHCRRLLAKGELDGRKWGRDWTVFQLNYTRKRKPKRGEK
jgi:excisionase family DNA binding protein